MKIDVLVPSYRAPEPLMLDSVNQAIDYSSCKCGITSWQTGYELSQAAIERRKPKLHLQANPFHDPAECPFGKHDVRTPPRVSTSVIQKSRNVLLQMRREDADYVLFIDDDIVIAPDTIDRLLSHKKDIVAGLCVIRIDPPVPVIRQWVEETQNYGEIRKWNETNRLLQVDAVGTGLILLSQQVIEDVALAYHRESYLREGRGEWFEFLRNEWDSEWGEDISFCWKATRIGYPVYVDLSVQPAHLGDYTYTVDDYKAYQEKYLEGLRAKGLLWETKP
jgi:hypothetical protein